MAYIDKYLSGACLDRDPVQDGVLHSFEQVVQGTADYSRIFKMVADEHVRQCVDDDDYQFWLDQKQKYEQKEE